MEHTDFGKINPELLNGYLELLTQKYDELEGDPFANKARLKLRSEIEDVRAMLSESHMDEVWRSLTEVFGMAEQERPKWSGASHEQEKRFREKFEGKVVIGDDF